MPIKNGQQREVGLFNAVPPSIRLHSSFDLDKSSRYGMRAVCELKALK